MIEHVLDLGNQLKTVADIMATGSKIPFINENKKMKDALKIITNKNSYNLVNNRVRCKWTWRSITNRYWNYWRWQR